MASAGARGKRTRKPAISGLASANFGDFPGRASTSVTVSGQTDITADSRVQAWVGAYDSADHTLDEHIIEDFAIVAGRIEPGVGFTIYVTPRMGVATGVYNIQWMWV